LGGCARLNAVGGQAFGAEIGDLNQYIMQAQFGKPIFVNGDRLFFLEPHTPNRNPETNQFKIRKDEI